MDRTPSQIVMALRSADPALVAMTREADRACRNLNCGSLVVFPPLQDWYEERGFHRSAGYARQWLPINALAACFEDTHGGLVPFVDLYLCLEDLKGEQHEHA